MHARWLIGNEVEASYALREVIKLNQNEVSPELLMTNQSCSLKINRNTD